MKPLLLEPEDVVAGNRSTLVEIQRLRDAAWKATFIHRLEP